MHLAVLTGAAAHERTLETRYEELNRLTQFFV